MSLIGAVFIMLWFLCFALVMKEHKVNKFDGGSMIAAVVSLALPALDLKLHQSVGELVEAPDASEVSGLRPSGLLSCQRRQWCLPVHGRD
jgi:hypothetical protein